ncbi:hypothetical protein CDLVIII_5063 [Clostridium sp. DL-VIII]|uniref:ABC-2 transporter permease n=1 Tax=Clostridium sp. DL-VIII TaxID=641107 RepID=UPI00023B06AE|nr:ABC-2 transporter permease [Clostridium sp. DL-VIII]EHJ01554.1 hypothetical protein CDLVIII_5063 [Clostridium sp. DL-VIII]
MKRAINYFKLDLRMIKKKSITLLIALIIFLGIPLISFSKSFHIELMLCLIGSILFIEEIPFFIQDNEMNSEYIYNMFPAKISEMVLGRFLFLISIILIICAISVFGIIYVYFGGIENKETIMIFGIIAIILLIMEFIEYAILYRLPKKGIQVFNIVLMILGISAPGLIVKLVELSSDGNKEIIQAAIINNGAFILVVGIVVLGIVAISSYKISCKICEGKDF